MIFDEQASLTQAPGATAAEWAHWQTLGLTADMLPVVSDLTVPISAVSRIGQLDGKTPTQINGAGDAVGMPGWSKRTTTAREVERWAKDGRHGIGLVGRQLKAFDIDIDDATAAGAVRDFIELTLGALPCRSRSNSGKCLLAFRMTEPMPKSRIVTAAGVIELLGERQQFLIAGTHKSGARYDWEGGLPTQIPELTRAEVDAAWQALAESFGTAESTAGDAYVMREPVHIEGVDLERDIVIKRWDVDHEDPKGRLHGPCPWAVEHSEGGAEFAMYLPAAVKGQGHSGFKCLHAHCEGRTVFAFLRAIGVEAEKVRDEFEPVLPGHVAEMEQAETTARAVRFKPTPWHEFAGGVAPVWIVRGLLPQAELCVIYGESGSGKTFFALDLVCAVARGVEWRGRRVKPGRVVYICAEGVAGFRKRVQAYAHAHGVAHEAMQLDVIADAPDLLGNDHKALAAAIGSASLVVVDTLAQTTPGANENSGEDMGKALAHCKALHRATGALIVLIHHSGKDATRGARGWSGLKGACDAEIEVTRTKDVRSARVSKQKDGEEGEALPFKLQPVLLGTDDDGDEITSCTVVAADAAPVQRPEPSGESERLVWAVAREMLFDADRVPEGALITKAVALRDPPADGVKDHRRDNLKRTLAGLIEKRYMLRDDDGNISLISLTVPHEGS